MSNAASSPEFRQILRDVIDEGHHGKKSGGVLKEAWRRYKTTYGNKSGLRRTKCKICRRIHAPGEVRHAFNPRKKKIIKRCKTCGGIVHGSVCLNCLKMNPHHQKNPIAIYNPANKTLLPMSIIEIRYRRSGGAYHGQLFKHQFKNKPKVYGLPDGSVLLRGGKFWGEA